MQTCLPTAGVSKISAQLSTIKHIVLYPTAYHNLFYNKIPQNYFPLRVINFWKFRLISSLTYISMTDKSHTIVMHVESLIPPF